MVLLTFELVVVVLEGGAELDVVQVAVAVGVVSAEDVVHQD